MGEYPRGTLGYHREFAEAMFGPNSPAIAWIDKEAAASPDGLNASVTVPEQQMVLMLQGIHHRTPSLEERLRAALGRCPGCGLILSVQRTRSGQWEITCWHHDRQRDKGHGVNADTLEGLLNAWRDKWPDHAL